MAVERSRPNAGLFRDVVEAAAQALAVAGADVQRGHEVVFIGVADIEPVVRAAGIVKKTCNRR